MIFSKRTDQRVKKFFFFPQVFVNAPFIHITRHYILFSVLIEHESLDKSYGHTSRSPTLIFEFQTLFIEFPTVFFEFPTVFFEFQTFIFEFQTFFFEIPISFFEFPTLIFELPT